MGSTTFAQQQDAKAPAKQEKAAKTKKNGTPDMRNKDNKEAAKPAQHLKKDGTPDMRYKENKKAAAKSPAEADKAKAEKAAPKRSPAEADKAKTEKKAADKIKK